MTAIWTSASAFSGDGATIRMGTWVRPRNLFGRAYLACVMPFHILIVRNAMARIGRSGA